MILVVIPEKVAILVGVRNGEERTQGLEQRGKQLWKLQLLQILLRQQHLDPVPLLGRRKARRAAAVAEEPPFPVLASHACASE
jgi:hypothetical protein